MQLVVAGLGGVLATLADVLCLMVLVKVVAAPVPLSAFIAATVGAVVGFTVNKYVAFRDRSPITVEQLARFAFVALTTALLMAGAMKLVAVELRVPVLPNGDYYLYLAPDLSFGTFGHPWEQTICVFGAPLLAATESNRPRLLTRAVRSHVAAA